MKFTQIPVDTFKQIQLNAGILATGFVPSTGEVSGLLGATSGGVQFTDDVEYKDFGDDIDNCPKNMLELKKLDKHEAKMGGTFVTVNAATSKKLVGAADVDPNDSTHIIPRNDLKASDFSDLWWIGDYSDQNDGANAGFMAIHLLNGLNTGGFQIQSTDREKGKFAFEFMGHYSMAAQDTVPYELYVREGSAVVTPSVNLDSHAISIEDGGTATLTATVVPNTASVTWTSANTSVATVAGGVVTAEAEGNTIITAAITVGGVTYNDTCTVVVTAVESA